MWENPRILDAFKIDLLKQLRIEFIGEVCIDSGGVLRDWFFVVFKDLLNPSLGLFVKTETDEMSYIINPLCNPNKKNLEYFNFVGSMIGKAMLENVKVNTCFNILIFKTLFGKDTSYRDAKYIDSQVYRSLKNGKNKKGSLSGLYYTATIKTGAEEKSVELVENGAETAIIGASDYLAKLLEFYLKRMEPFIEALRSSLIKFVPIENFEKFTANEIKFLINGTGEIDVEDWKNNTTYLGNYSVTHNVIKWFWELLTEISQEDKQAFLQFSTGSSMIPIEGFK